jgi:hypothetical protein
LLSQQYQPHPPGDIREQITRARQAAEALFTAKPPVDTPAIAPPVPADRSARKPSVLQVIPPPAAPPARYDEPDTPAAATPLAEISPSQIARIRTWIKYGMKVAQAAQVYGVPVGEIELLLGKA